jgi:CRISPR/Cas system-associated exonuclease Cas4 (RecB family)
LYYENTGAKRDEEPQIPMRNRISRNGTAVHNEGERDLKRLNERLPNAPFKFVDLELKGERTFNVNGVIVRIKGRTDGLIEYKQTGERLIYERKTLSNTKKLKKITKEGVQPSHIVQGYGYFLLFSVDKILYEYESLQKDWSKTDEPDTAYFVVEIDKDRARQILIRLASVVEAIENEEIPEKEESFKCTFCSYQGICGKQP